MYEAHAIIFEPRSHCCMCHSPASFSTFMGNKLNTHLGFRLKNRKGIAVKVFKCKKCGLVYSNPQPLNEGRHFSKLKADPLLTHSQIPYPGSFTRELAMLKKLMDKPLDKLDAMDLGFGYGNSLITMKRNFKTVKGIEPFDEIYEFALKHPELKGLEKQLLKEDFDKIDFEESSVDFIFFEAFQHVHNPGAALQKALKWLRPKGIIYLEVPSGNWLISKLINFYYKLRGTQFVTNLSPIHGNFTNFEFTHFSFRENAKINGFKILHHEYIPCESGFRGPVNKILQTLMKLTNTGMQLGIYIQKF